MSSQPNNSIPQDYHMHSRHSWDTRIPMQDMCQAALEAHIPEIAFTEHFDHFTEDKKRASYEAVPFFEDLQACRASFGPHGLTIRAGVEVGEPHLHHATVQPVLDAHPYDMVLGSLHWVDGESVFQSRYYEGRTPHQAIKPYFDELLVMIEQGDFDILAHMDVFKRRAFLVYGGFDITDWEAEVRAVWQACIEQGVGIEINTGGLRWQIGQPHPDLTALTWYREMGGQILTIGSDAHRPTELGYALDQSLDMARAAGFNALARFEKRQVIDFTPI